MHVIKKYISSYRPGGSKGLTHRPTHVYFNTTAAQGGGAHRGRGAAPRHRGGGQGQSGGVLPAGEPLWAGAHPWDGWV